MPQRRRSPCCAALCCAALCFSDGAAGVESAASHAASQRALGPACPPALRRFSTEEEGGAEPAGPEQPGLNLPALALSNQDAQPPEEVVLFCGIIDFLQVRGGPAGFAGAGGRVLSSSLLPASMT